jgi:hypothetical protein
MPRLGARLDGMNPDEPGKGQVHPNCPASRRAGAGQARRTNSSKKCQRSVEARRTFLNQVYGRADAFLFGRVTYEIFAGSWGTWADPGDSPIWTALNTRPKYVASTTLTEPRWADTSASPHPISRTWRRAS